MKNKRLGVNIDHIATVRNARGENYPDPLKAALLCEKFGANSVTIHLREDRRHIRDHDLADIKKKIRIPLNLEMSPTYEMLKIAKKYKPDYVCIVTEKRKEITTEGGLNLKKNKNKIKKIIYNLKRNKIRVSLFIEPKIHDVKLSKILGADCVELHTGKYCNTLNKKKNTSKLFHYLKKSSKYAKKIGLEVHAGHGLTYESAFKVSRIKEISEFNIGHFLVSESLFFGIGKIIKKFSRIIKT